MASATLLGALPVAALPLVAGEYVVHVMAIAAYYVILAASWNLLAGFTGQFSLAHHGFAAIGGYASGLLVYHLQDTAVGQRAVRHRGGRRSPAS